MGFFADLASSDNTKVHTPAVILMVTGTILMALSIALIIFHCFIHGKGIDGETVKLILGILGGGVLNVGASAFSKTVISKVEGEAPPAPRVAKPE